MITMIFAFLIIFLIMPISLLLTIPRLEKKNMTKKKIKVHFFLNFKVLFSMHKNLKQWHLIKELETYSS